MQPRFKLAGLAALSALYLAAGGVVWAQEISGAATTTTKAMDKAPRARDAGDARRGRE